MLSAQGWGSPCSFLRGGGSTETLRGPPGSAPPLRPECLGASPCSRWEGQVPALPGAIGTGHRCCPPGIQVAGAAFKGPRGAPPEPGSPLA